jgi:hypothetical protein
MKRPRCVLLFALALLWVSGRSVQAQTPEPESLPETLSLFELGCLPPAEAPSTDQTFPLVVPEGLPLLIALDQEVRVHQAGEAIHGKTVQPVYAFDRVVIPAGTQVTGQITRIDSISNKRRTLSALDGDFTPGHKLGIEFNELVFPDGRHIPVHTVVTPGFNQVMEFVQAKGNEEKKEAKSTASQKIDQATQEAKRTWDETMKQVQEPGRMHRLEHYLIAQLPIHPQYLNAGTLYSAELQEPLDFGTTPLTPELAASLTREPPHDSLVHALLVTPLSSATSQRGDEVEAMLWQPLFDGDHLILPAGTMLKGSVIQAQPARKMHHNGQLRVAFHNLIGPEGLDEKVSATLLGVTASKEQHVKLDSEGGAQSTSPNSRYLSTAIAVGLAAASAKSDSDARFGGGAGGDATNRAAGGAAGFRLIGIVVGAFVHSQPLGMAMGSYGAGISIYRHFIARGGELVFPKNTAMELSIGTHPSAPASGSTSAPVPR